MTNTWYASDWDQPYRPSYQELFIIIQINSSWSYAKICRTVVRHIQVHLYQDTQNTQRVVQHLGRSQQGHYFIQILWH